MRTVTTGGMLAAAFGAALAVAAPVPASAQLARPQTAAAIASDDATVTQVQWRRGWRGGWRGPGPAIGLGLGFATGAIIGGALASPYYASPYYCAPPPRVYYGAPQPYYDAPEDDAAIASCAQRYRSYDPQSGTYLGYDGQRHPCP